MLDARGGDLNMSEMQRVALARVLVTKPELLLLDEPMSNLDASLRASLRSELKQIQKDLEQTVLYVTHDQVEALSMSDRIAVMRNGAVLQADAPEEIYHRPVDLFVAQFIGDPPINIVPCRVEEVQGKLVVDTALHSGLGLAGRDVPVGDYLLAVRPHHLSAHHEPREGTAESEIRLVENFGAEHVLHVTYGNDLVSVVTAPGFALEGERLHLSLDINQAHLIDRRDERVLTRRHCEAAA
jgi:ABC-type sugar transport system ATPase subunit